MPATTDVDAVSDILRTADELGLDFQPTDLPQSAYGLYEAIYDSLIPRLNLKQPQRQRIALDTAVSLCDDLAGNRLVPATVDAAKGAVAHCFGWHGVAAGCIPHTLRVLALYCQGGIVVPTLKTAYNLLRDEQVRRDFRQNPDYPAIARRYGLSASRVRQICTPANRSANGSSKGAPANAARPEASTKSH